MKITIREPNGQESELASILEIKDLFLEPRKEYWLSGSGDLGIYFHGPVIAILIIVFCKDEDGFFAQFYPKIGANDWLVAINDFNSEKNLTVYVGGNEMKIPESVVISREITFEIASHFMEHGNNWEGANWKSYWDIDWPDIE
jgi:hypothetical protein